MRLKSILTHIASGVSIIALLGSSSLALAQAIIDGGVTVTVPPDHGGNWNVGSALIVGDNGTGTLAITNGGTVSNTTGTIGYNTGGTGAVTVDGTGSTWVNSDYLIVGYGGTGTLEITNGGTVSSSDGFIGVNTGGTGAVTVDGRGSTWENSGDLSVGLLGTGMLDITNGGTVSNTTGYIGLYSGSTGVVTVGGTGSTWINSVGLYVGFLSGTGTLAIADHGDVSTPQVTVAQNGSSTGVLAIGAASGSVPLAPGTITTASLTFGAGDGRIVFNHISENYVFDATVNGGANNAVGSGTGLVGAGLVEAIAGRTIFNADHGDFTGTLQASDTGILQINGNLSGGSANILAGGVLEGNGIVGSTVNAGTVSIGASIGTLTIAGNYVGNGGMLQIEAVLGDDASATDKLIVEGNVSGNTTVHVTNLGGEGAETINGIRIIEIGGASPADAFILNGDYTTETGQQSVIGGVYAYTLQHGGMETPNDGNWYLVSEMTVIDPETGIPKETKRYQPGIPLYEQYPQVLAALNTVPTLQQRVGNRYWQPGTADGAANTYGMWGRIEGSRTESNPARSTAQAHRDVDLWRLQAGFDFTMQQNKDGMLVGGVNVSYGTASSEIGSPYGRGKIDATGTGIGATLTWYGAGGFYVDTQAQAMFFDSDITSTTIGRKEVKGNGGHGLALSGETGWRYQLGNGFSLTPQVQLTWSRVDFDSFVDPYGAGVSLKDGDSLRGRLGLSLDRETSWTASDGTRSKAHVYEIVNLYNEFLNGQKTAVDDVMFRTRDERLWAGIGLGGTYEWNNGKYTLYGNVNLSGATSHISDNNSIAGTIGFRAQW